jgi:hypothetical protein
MNKVKVARKKEQGTVAVEKDMKIIGVAPHAFRAHNRRVSLT